MVFHSPYKKLSKNFVVTINGTNLDQIGENMNEQSVKFLGIHMDECLTWKHHIAHIKNKLSKSLFMIKQTKNVLHYDTLKTLYYTMVHPHLLYGIIAWGNAANKYLEGVCKMQKRAIRVIHKAKYNSHTEPLFKSSGILKLEDLHNWAIVIFMNDYFTGKLPKSFHNIFKMNKDIFTSYDTRQGNQLYIKRTYSIFAEKQPIFHLPIVWNKWSPGNYSPYQSSRSTFKKIIKSNILASYSDRVRCDNLHCKTCSGNNQ